MMSVATCSFVTKITRENNTARTSKLTWLKSYAFQSSLSLKFSSFRFHKNIWSRSLIWFSVGGGGGGGVMEVGSSNWCFFLSPPLLQQSFVFVFFLLLRWMKFFLKSHWWLNFFLQKLPFHHWILGLNWIFLLHCLRHQRVFFFYSSGLVIFFFQSQQWVIFFFQKNFHPPPISNGAPLRSSWIFHNFFSNFLQFDPILAQILEKKLKIDPLPINIPNLTYNRGWYIRRRLILLLMLAALPLTVFCNEYPHQLVTYVYALMLLLGGPGGCY